MKTSIYTPIFRLSKLKVIINKWNADLLELIFGRFIYFFKYIDTNSSFDALTYVGAKNPEFKLESQSRMQGLDSSDAHSALTAATLTAKILSIIKKRQPNPQSS